MTSAPQLGLLIAAVLASAVAGCRGTDARAVPTDPTLQVNGVAYATAQQVRWLGKDHLLVGRWDGTLGLFEVPRGQTARPRLVESVAMPAGEGIQMLEARNADSFVSSAREDALMWWRRGTDGSLTGELVAHSPSLGIAVSGIFAANGDQELLVTGHEMGFIAVWSVSPEGRIALLRTVDLRMEHAIDYLHDDEPLRHIRGLAPWRDGVVIAGGEDGGLHQVRLADGAVLAQRLFNRSARLGVNDLAVRGDRVVVVNCALDRDDRNVWLFDLSEGAFELADAANLLLDQDRDRVFAFDVTTHDGDDGDGALITTKEGLVWRVRIGNGQIEPLGHLALGRFDYGNAIDFEEHSRRLAAASVGIRILSLMEPTPPRSGR